jgi:glutamate--cysteine ligase
MSQIIQILKTIIFAKKDEINQFFDEKFAKNPAIFYNSVDLRHSGFKIAPVDTNCFPAGFNNIQGNSQANAKKIAENFIKSKFGSNFGKKIMVIPENHTRNLNYLQNLLSLQEILKTDENEVIIGSMIEELQDNTTISLENGQNITLHKIFTKEGGKITTKSGFEPDLIILNNDLTGKIPEILQNLTIPITPPTSVGWFQRLKSNHFDIYNEVAKEISEILNIDPWLISSFQSTCNEVDFKRSIGFECLAKEVDSVILQIQEKYNQHGIKDKPFCYIKADNGTYGMAVMQANSGEDILSLNKKDRNKMNMLKESVQVASVFVQEGIPTIDKIDDMSAEPLIYMIGGQVVGNLFRANASRDERKSLNATGANFYDLKDLKDNQLCLGCIKENMTVIYELIARLAALSSAIEAQNYQQS